MNAFIKAPEVTLPSVYLPVGSYNTGDNRNHLQNDNARISAGVILNTETRTVLGMIGPYAGQTKRYNPDASLHSTGYSDLSGVNMTVVKSGTLFTITITGAASNPTLALFSPDIDFSFTIKVDTSTPGNPVTTITQADHDAYPSWEIYTQQYGGANQNGGAKSLKYMYTESTPMSLVAPLGQLFGGVAPASYRAPEVPFVQSYGTFNASDWEIYWVNASSDNGPAAVVKIGPFTTLQYQPPGGGWYDWEN